MMFAIPAHLKCPILGTLMSEPVLVTQAQGRLKAGETYERKTVVKEIGCSASFVPNDAIRDACFGFLFDVVTARVPIHAIPPTEISRAMTGLLDKVVGDPSIADHHHHARAIASSGPDRSSLLDLCKILVRSNAYQDKVEGAKKYFRKYPIKVKDFSGSEKELTVDPEMTIRHVKKLITSKCSSKYRLMHCGLELTDSQSLDESNVWINSVLEMEMLGSETQWKGLVFVKSLSGRTYEIEAQNSDTVAMIKDRIEKEGGIPAEEQRLICVGKLLEDLSTLDDYGLEAGVTMHLVLKISNRPKTVRPAAPLVSPWKGPIFIRTLTGRLLELETESSSTVKHLKNMIHESEGIPPDQMHLIFAGLQLEESSSLAECNVAERGTVHMVVRLRGGMHHVSTTGTDASGHTTFDVMLPHLAFSHEQAPRGPPRRGYSVSVRRGATCAELHAAVVREAVVGLFAFPEPFELRMLRPAGDPCRLDPASDELAPGPGERAAVEVAWPE